MRTYLEGLRIYLAQCTLVRGRCLAFLLVFWRLSSVVEILPSNCLSRAALRAHFLLYQGIEG